MTRHLHDERGSITVELAILAPALLLLLGLLVFAGRVQTSSASIEQAARAAARDASLARTADAARATAQSAAARELAGSNCTSVTVVADTTGFGARLGDDAAVAVTVTCTVSIADLAVPGLPGTRTLSSDAVSPIDRYRSR